MENKITETVAGPSMPTIASMLKNPEQIDLLASELENLSKNDLEKINLALDIVSEYLKQQALGFESVTTANKVLAAFTAIIGISTTTAVIQAGYGSISEGRGSGVLVAVPIALTLVIISELLGGDATGSRIVKIENSTNKLRSIINKELLKR